MTTILHIQCGANLKSSVTRQIGQLVTEALQARDPSARVIRRDLVADPPPHLSPAFVAAMFSEATTGDEFALSNQLIEDLFASDVFVIEAPMYNFGIPSALKAWFDHVVRVRKTFRTTETGAEGMLEGKQAILVLGSGFVYSDGPFKVMDFVEPYLRAMLGFIGVTDLETIRIEYLNMGPEKAARSIAQAKQRVSQLFTHARQRA